MTDDLEAQIQAKESEFKEAQKLIEKYDAMAPLSTSMPIGHNMDKMKRDYDKHNKIRDEYMDLLRQRRDTK